MADLREVVIKITNEEQETTSVESNSKTKETTDIKPVTLILLNQVYEGMKSAVVSQVNYEIDKHFNLTDDYIGKRSFNEAMNVINFTASLVTSAVVGAKIGSAGGVIGSVAGAIIGAGTTLVSQAINVSQNYDNAQIELRQIDYQLSYSRERAGYSLTSGSLGENR